MNGQEINQPDRNKFPTVAVLILNWNGRSLLPISLPPLLAQAYPHYEVVLVDNGSTDDSVAYVVEHFSQVNIIRLPENLGFARGYNAAFKQCQAEIVVLLNNDVIVQDDWLAEMIRPFSLDSTIGTVGCKLLFPDGTIQHLGAQLSYPLALSHHTAYRQPDTDQRDEITDTAYVTGAALAIPHALLASLDFFDEAFSPFYYEEVDLCYRVRAAGYRVVINSWAVGIHDESTSMRQVRSQKIHAYHKNRLHFVLKHYTPAQVLDDFVPAEQQRLAHPTTAHEYHVLRRAYLETAVAAADIPTHSLDPGQKRAIQHALLSLYRTAVAQEPAAHELVADGWPQAALAQQHALTEPDFRSDKPLIGPLIVAFRRLWHSIAGKWALRQLMQQQNRFNALAARLFDEQYDRSETTAWEIELLSKELVRLQQTISQLQQRLETVVQHSVNSH